MAVSREGADQYELSEFIQNTPCAGSAAQGRCVQRFVQRSGGKLVQVQLNQDKIDGINAKLLELIDTQLAAARSQLESAERRSPPDARNTKSS